MIYTYECPECGNIIKIQKKLEELEDCSKPIYKCSQCLKDKRTVYMTRTLNSIPFKVKGFNASNGYS